MDFDHDTVDKTLIVRLGAIGDIILSNPALAAVRTRFPKTSIHLLIDHNFSEIARDNPNIDDILLFPAKNEPKRHKKLFQFIKNVRSDKYDLVIDLDGTPRSAWLTFFTGGKIRLGPGTDWRSNFAYTLHSPSPEPVEHNQKTQRSILNPLGVDLSAQPVFFLSVDQESVAAIKERLTSFGMSFDRPTALLLPGAQDREKKWPAEKMGILARWLVDEKDMAVVIAGAESCKDEIDRIRKTSGYALPALTEFTLAELIALIDIADLVVCNHSGPMHIAGVLNRPTIALFGPTDPLVWAPVGKRKIILTPTPMECMPCSHDKECPYKGDYCTSRIEVGEVKRAVNRLAAFDAISGDHN